MYKNLPKEWEVVRLGEISEIGRGASPRPKGDPRYFGGNIPWIKISDLSKYKVGLFLVRTDDTVTEEGKKKSVYLKDGSLIVSNSGTIGEPAIIKTGKGGCVHDGFIFVKPLKGVEKYYLYYFFDFKKTELQLRAQKGTQGNMNTTLWKSLKIPLPPLPEQKKIAEILSTVDKAIQKVDGAIAKTERLKKGLMQELLTKGIGHTEFKDTKIGRIPKEWEVVKLEKVTTEVSIGVVSSETPYYTSPENGVPYFRSQNVKENKLIPTDIYVTKEFNEKHKKSVLREDDILTIQTGNIGTSCVVPKEFEGANCHSLLITRTNRQILDPYFLCYFLNSTFGKSTIMRLNAGWGRNHLLLQDFRKLKIPLPPLPEQQKIAEILSTVDKKLGLERKRKEKLERIKKGLMNDLLTGKKRVRV